MSLFIVIASVIFTVLFVLVVGVGVWFFRMMHNKKYNIDIVIRTQTAGKPQVAMHKGGIILTKRWGYLIHCPKPNLIMQRFNNDAFLPSNMPGRYILDITAKDGYYYVNQLTAIERTFKEGTAQEEIKKLLAEKYKLTPYETVEEIINPIPHVDRSAAVQAQNILNQLTEERQPWYKNPMVVGIGFGLMGLVVAVLIIVLAKEHASEIIANASALCSAIPSPQPENGVIDAVSGFVQPQ